MPRRADEPLKPPEANPERRRALTCTLPRLGRVPGDHGTPDLRQKIRVSPCGTKLGRRARSGCRFVTAPGPDCCLVAMAASIAVAKPVVAVKGCAPKRAVAAAALPEAVSRPRS